MKNNKGFSLIELIIVIAIMAVLGAVLAPNLTKYLSKSKYAADKKNVDQVISILEQACALTETEVKSPDSSKNGVWVEIQEDSPYFDSDASDINGLQAFPAYVAETLNNEVPKSKVNGKHFEAKITKISDPAGDYFTVEVRVKS